jgi:hypothetical protein
MLACLLDLFHIRKMAMRRGIDGGKIPSILMIAIPWMVTVSFWSENFAKDPQPQFNRYILQIMANRPHYFRSGPMELTDSWEKCPIKNRLS